MHWRSPEGGSYLWAIDLSSSTAKRAILHTQLTLVKNEESKYEEHQGSIVNAHNRFSNCLPLKWAVVPNLDADPGPDGIAAKPKLCSDATKIPNLVVSDPPRASAFSFFIALFYFLLKTGRPKQSQGRDELKGSLHRNRKNWVNRTQFWTRYSPSDAAFTKRKETEGGWESHLFTESTLYNTSMKQEENFILFMVRPWYLRVLPFHPTLFRVVVERV